jgi:hypothetical protein
MLITSNNEMQIGKRFLVWNLTKYFEDYFNKFFPEVRRKIRKVI